MNKSLFESLKEKTIEVAARFSDPTRTKNYTQEQFTVDSIVPVCDTVAFVRFKKNTGKLALAVFFYVNSQYNNWYYFFPTDSHVLGFIGLREEKLKIEEHNAKIGDNDV